MRSERFCGLRLRGESHRSIDRLSLVDRKTVRRYVAAVQACGLVRDGHEAQLSDELVGQVVRAASRRCALEVLRGWSFGPGHDGAHRRREPGSELQVDFGKMGLVPDPTTGKRRVAQALILARPPSIDAQSRGTQRG